MRFVNLETGDFIGRDETIASQQAAEAGTMPWICAYLAIDADGKADGHGGEAVMHDGRVVGSTSSVAYGHSVGKVLAFSLYQAGGGGPGNSARGRVHERST